MPENTPWPPLQTAELDQPCDEWQALAQAAAAAGRWAARQLACHSPLSHLNRTGQITVHVEPADSPVAAWLADYGHGSRDATGVLVPITVAPADLAPAPDAAGKADSLLIAHAYAVAYCTVLATEAGAATDIHITTCPPPTPPAPTEGSSAAADHTLTTTP